MSEDRHQKNTKDFFRMLEWPGALGLGGLVAFVVSLKQVNPQVRLEFDVWSLVALVVGTIGSYVLIHAVIGKEGKNIMVDASAGGRNQGQGAKRKLWFLGAILAVGTVAAFLYALKDLSPAKRWDIAIGAGAAMALIAVVMFLFWRLVRFLEKQGVPEDDEDRKE